MIWQPVSHVIWSRRPSELLPTNIDHWVIWDSSMWKQPSKQLSAGAFQRIPQVPAADDHLKAALRKASRIVGNKKIKGRLQHTRNLSARKLDALTKEIATPLGAIVRAFPACAQLHPFEKALLDLTIGIEDYEKRLEKLNNLRKSCLEVCETIHDLCARQLLQQFLSFYMENWRYSMPFARLYHL